MTETDVIRPPILNRDGKLSKNVKGLIYDLNKQLIGMVIIKGSKMFIQFFARFTPSFVFDVKTGEVETYIEEYSDDPKKVLKKIVGDLGKVQS